jgi:hypothetical protein
MTCSTHTFLDLTTNEQIKGFDSLKPIIITPTFCEAVYEFIRSISDRKDDNGW